MMPFLNRDELRTSTPLRDTYKELFNRPLPSQVHTCIIGGGISGILMALKASQGTPPGSTLILDAAPHLGGRLNFAPPPALGATPWERFLSQALSPPARGGWGFDVLPPAICQTYMRHIFQHLDDCELDFWHSWCKDTQPFGPPRSYVFKKELIELQDTLTSSSELFTKKEALWLESAIRTQGDGFGGPLGQWPPWKALSAPQKSPLTATFECVFGSSFEQMPALTLFSLLGGLFSPEPYPIPTLMARVSQPELPLELILRRRGILMGLGHKVDSISSAATPKHWRVEASHGGSSHAIECLKVVSTTPLGRSFHFIPREFLKPNQSKWASKLRPLSIVALEYSNCAPHVIHGALTEASPGTTVLLPSHKCIATFTSLGSVVFWCWVEFEESLHAPAVKDKVIHLRKAAQKLFMPPGQTPPVTNKSGPSKATGPGERVVLLPVGRGLPWVLPTQSALTDVALSKEGLFAAGDGVHLGSHPWECVLGTVEAVTQALKGVSSPCPP